MTVTGPGQGPHQIPGSESNVNAATHVSQQQQTTGTQKDTLNTFSAELTALNNILSDLPELLPPNPNTNPSDIFNMFGLNGTPNFPKMMTPGTRDGMLTSQYMNDPNVVSPNLKEDVQFYLSYPEELQSQLAKNPTDPHLQDINKTIQTLHHIVVQKMIEEGYDIPEDFSPKKASRKFNEVVTQARYAKLQSNLKKGSNFVKQHNLSKSDINALRNAYQGITKEKDLPQKLKGVLNQLKAKIDGEIKTQYDVPAQLIGPKGLINTPINTKEFQADVQSSFDLQFESFIRAQAPNNLTEQQVSAAIYSFYNPGDKNISSAIRSKVQNLEKQFAAKFESQYGMPKGWSPSPETGVYNKSISAAMQQIIYKYLHPNSFGADPNTIPKDVRGELETYLTNQAKGIKTDLSPKAKEYLAKLTGLVQNELHKTMGVPMASMPALQYTPPTGQSFQTIAMIGQASSQLQSLHKAAKSVPSGPTQMGLMQLMALVDKMLQEVKVIMYKLQMQDSLFAKYNIEAALDAALGMASEQKVQIHIAQVQRKKLQKEIAKQKKAEKKAKAKAKKNEFWMKFGKWCGYIIGGAIALLAAPFTLGASLVVFALIVGMTESQSKPPKKSQRGIEGMRNTCMKWMEDCGIPAKDAKWMSWAVTAIALTACVMNPMMAQAVLFQGGAMQNILLDCGASKKAAKWTSFALNMATIIVEMVVVGLLTGGAGDIGIGAELAAQVARMTGRGAEMGEEGAEAAEGAEGGAEAAQGARKAGKVAKMGAKISKKIKDYHAGKYARKGYKAFQKAQRKSEKAMKEIEEIQKDDTKTAKEIEKIIKEIEEKVGKKAGKLHGKSGKNIRQGQSFVKKAGEDEKYFEKAWLKAAKEMDEENPSKLRKTLRFLGKGLLSMLNPETLAKTAGNIALTVGRYKYDMAMVQVYKIQAQVLLMRADMAINKGDLEAYMTQMMTFVKLLRKMANELMNGMKNSGDFAKEINGTMNQMQNMWSQSITQMTQS